MKNKILIATVAAFALAILLSLGAALVLADSVERRAEGALRQALAEAELGWVEVGVDGLTAHLSGEAPDESQRIRALRVAGEVIDASRLSESIQVISQEGIVAPVFRLEVMRSALDLSVIGLVPASGDGGALVERLQEAIAGAEVSDMLQSADFAVPQGWVAAVDFALAALNRFEVGRISVTAGRIEVEALVDSEDERRTLETALRAIAPRGQVVVLNLIAPRPVASPYLLRLERDPGGAMTLVSCAADTDEAQTRIARALSRSGYSRRVSCPLALGAPSPRWAEAAERGIEALTRVGGGTLVMSDALVSLTARHDVSDELFDSAVGQLESRLPEAFTLSATRAPAPDESSDTGTGTPELTAVLTEAGRVTLTGRLPDARIRTAVESLARARFGAEAVEMGVRLDDGLPQGWSVRVLAGIEALAELHHGRVRITESTLAINGVSGNPDAATQVAQAITETLGANTAFTADVRYDEALDPVAQAPTPESCEARVQEILARTKITFDPGSTDITREAGVVIDEIAEVLRECGELPFEVAGFTDSQGRDETNRAISQGRAEAVINALLARRVLVSSLVARGYGEENPVAPNDTEEGREANRRIEFRLIRPEPEPEPYDPAIEASIVVEAQEATPSTPRPRPRPDRN